MAGKQFLGKITVDNADILGIKNDVEIAVSLTISVIMLFRVLHINSRWLPKDSGEMNFGRSSQMTADTLQGKNTHQNCSGSHSFQDKCNFAFHAEIQNDCQNCQENVFWEKPPGDSADTLTVKNVAEIALSHTVSEINAFLPFPQKFKMAGNDFWKKCPVDSAHTLDGKRFH